MPKIKLKKAKTFIGTFILLKTIILLFLLFFIFSVESKDSIVETISIVEKYEKIDIKNINFDQIDIDLKNINNEKISYKEKIEILNKIIEIYFNSNNMKKAAEVVELSLKMADNKTDIEAFKLSKAYILNKSENKEDILESIKQIDQIVMNLKELDTIEARKIKFDATILKGDTYLYLNNGSEAIKAYNESDNYKYNELNIFDIKASKLFIYQSLELIDLALKELNELEKQIEIVSLEEDDKKYYYDIVYKMGVYLHEEKDNFKKSNEYALKFLKLSENMSLSSKIDTYHMVSSTYSNLNDFKNAEKYFDLVKEIIKSNIVDYDKKEELYAQYSYYKNKQEYDIALLILNDYEQLVGVEKISKAKYEIYKLMKDNPNAYKYLDIHINYLTSQIEEDELERYIKSTEKKHIKSLNIDYNKLNKEKEEKNKELEEYEKSNKILIINSYLVNTVIFLGLLSLIIIGFLYYKYYIISVTDGLTRVYNKRYLNKNVKKFSNIIILDIDYFKKVNDTYGHIAGDYLLKKVSIILKEELGNNGKVIRYGGEEFVLLLNDNVNGYELGEKIRTTIQNCVFNYEDKEIKITISLGLSSDLNKADKLLYQAKNSGRNKILINAEEIYV